MDETEDAEFAPIREDQETVKSRDSRILDSIYARLVSAQLALLRAHHECTELRTQSRDQLKTRDKLKSHINNIISSIETLKENHSEGSLWP